MFARVFHLLAVLMCVAFLAACEGERGPAGPAGPAGPSIIVCSGQIDGTEDPPEVESSWPSGVTVAVAPLAVGVVNVTLTGNFPSTPGTVLTSNVSGDGNRSLTGYLTGWSTSAITFRVGIWNTVIGEYADGRFSFAVLAGE